jgi:hypothetical protein
MVIRHSPLSPKEHGIQDVGCLNLHPKMVAAEMVCASAYASPGNGLVVDLAFHLRPGPFGTLQTSQYKALPTAIGNSDQSETVGFDRAA